MKRDWLIDLRKSKGFTQQKIADKSFIDRSYYSQIENGLRDPSPSVAENIAKVLNFNSVRFFKDYIYDPGSTMSKGTAIRLSNDIYAFFKSTEKGNVMYHYSNIDIFYKNTLTFILSKVEQNLKCIIVDKYENSLEIYSELETLLPKSKIDRYVYFFHHDVYNEDINRNFFKFIKKKMKESKEFSLWIHDFSANRDNSFSNLKFLIETCGKEFKHDKLLLVCSFDASLVSAQEYIKVMKIFHYMMTDQEVANSPLCSEHNTKILPSFNNLTDENY